MSSSRFFLEYFDDDDRLVVLLRHVPGEVPHLAEEAVDQLL